MDGGVDILEMKVANTACVASIEPDGVDARIGHVASVDAQSDALRVQQRKRLLKLVFEFEIGAHVLVNDGHDAFVESDIGDAIDEIEHL